jgi:hypothetical protein
MSTIVEEAIPGEIMNIREVLVDAVADGNHTQFPYAWCID